MRWYASPALKLKSISPLAFELLRFARRAVIHVATSRILMFCLFAIAGLVAWFSLDVRFADVRIWMLLGTAFGVLTAALAYVAARAQAHAAALHIEAHDMKVELVQLKEEVFGTSRTNALDQKLAFRDAQIGNVRASLQVLTTELNRVKASVSSETAQQIASLQSSVSTLEAQLADLTATVERVPEAVEQKATEVTSKLKSAHDEVAQKLAQVDSVLTRKFNEANTSIESMEERVETAAAAAGKVSDLESKLAATDKWAQFDNSRWFQHFNRRLSNEHTHTLETEWRKRLSLPISKQVLGYMASRACDIERRLDGRLATSVEDILLRTLIARAVKGKTLDVLEIGTLFATGAAIMYDSAAPHFDKTHFTLLDPLEGYYNSAQADILTGQVVNEAAVRRNLARVGMSEDEYTLIKNLSTTPEAIEAAGQKSYDVLVIDGDHSYAGVKADFENYAGFVKLGGYIILDDYNSPDWPDVTEYVDKELADHPYVSKVGSTWRTCVYRVVKTPARQTAPRRKPAAATPRKQAAETESE